jgi:hypothetical protein
MGSGSCFPESDYSIVCTSSGETAITSVAGCNDTGCYSGGSPCGFDSECCSQSCSNPDGSGGFTCAP